MLLANQIFDVNSIPDNYISLPTSRLMSNLAVSFNDRAVPLFTPIGTKVMHKIEDILKENAVLNGAEEVQIPLMMGTDLLRRGSEIGELFEKKIINLSGNLKDFHLMTSPEMMFLNLFSKAKLKEQHLPIHYFFTSDFCRDMPDPKGFLRGRQLRVFGGVAFDKTEDDTKERSKNVDSMLENSFNEMGIPFHREPGGSGFSSEFFYMNSKENENYLIPSINPNQKTKALSFGMNYEYIPEKSREEFLYRTRSGDKKYPHVTSYAISTQRLLYIVLDHYRDEKGFNLPENLRPIDIVLIPREDSMILANKIGYYLKNMDYDVAIDNFFSAPYKNRVRRANYLGAPYYLDVAPGKYVLHSRNGQTLKQSDKESDILFHLLSQKEKSSQEKRDFILQKIQKDRQFDR